MHLDKYLFQVSPDYFEYEFFSRGSKGIIKKIVRFDEFTTSEGYGIFNLALGDWNETKQAIDDAVVSNNGDTEKVLATVAFIALDFVDRFPNALLYIEGSTPARTRKYQIAISRHFEDIDELFNIFGITKQGEINEFTKNVNYEGFLFKSKL